MADTLTITGNGDPSLASYAVLLDGSDATITTYDPSTEASRTQIPLSGQTYTDDVLDADDLDCGYVDGTVSCETVQVFDSNDVLLAYWTLDPAIDLSNTESYEFIWPATGVHFDLGEPLANIGSISMALYTYPRFIEKVLGDLTIKAMLLESAAFDEDHDYVADIVADEVGASGYARQSVAGSVTYDEDGAYFNPTADYVDFGPFTGNFQGLAIFSDTGNDATSRLIGLEVYASPIYASNQTVRLNLTGNLLAGLV